MKAKLLKRLRKDAEYAISIEYAYPYFYVILNMAGYNINGVLKDKFNDLGIAMDYVTDLRRNFILSTARQSRIGGRRIM